MELVLRKRCSTSWLEFRKLRDAESQILLADQKSWNFNNSIN